MGAWGVGIRQDDFVLDVVGVFEDQLKDGKTILEATSRVREQFASALDDSQDGPLFWIALADMQWKFGSLDPQVLRRVVDIVDTEAGMEHWGEPTDKIYRQRRAVLEKFRDKISWPNPKPSRRPKRIIRRPKFKSGDCLSIQLENGQYGAALVLGTDHSIPEHGKDLVVELDYLSDTPPTLDDFKERRWLRLTHHNWKGRLQVAWILSMGFRKMKARISVVGNIPILDSDPKEATIYGGWHLLGQQVLLQHKWKSEPKP